MESQSCPACKADNETDARYCDQCGQALVREEPDGGEGEGCPACGGRVEERSGGQGVCTRCGLELVDETPAAAPPALPPDLAERLTSAIARRAESGLPIARAVAEGCREVLGGPPAAAAPARSRACPLCGAANPEDAAQCDGCRIWFKALKSPQPCPRCGEPTREDQCECGAVLTLPKLLEYVEPTLRWVCSRCKQPYAVPKPSCPECGAFLLGAERLQAYARTL